MPNTNAVDSQTTGIIWEAPPRISTKGKGTPSPRRQAMLENPGQWMVWADGAVASTANHLRKAGFQVTTRKIAGTDKVKVYTRWPKSRARRAALANA